MSFEHYPKYVTSIAGDSVVVNSEEEEIEVVGEVTEIEEHDVYVEPANKQTQDEFEYPKYIDGVIVKDADEELELLESTEAEDNSVLGDSSSGLDSKPFGFDEDTTAQSEPIVPNEVPGINSITNAISSI